MQVESERQKITRTWVAAVVVGMNFCPFARRVLEGDGLEIDEVTGDVEAVLVQLIECLRQMELSGAPETKLLLLPDTFKGFDEYLDLLGIADALLEDQGFSGEFQVASFHPDYCFEGTDASDAANFTNRSPFPMLHILRESSVEKAVSEHPDTDEIPLRNVEIARENGLDKMQSLLDGCISDFEPRTLN